MSSLKFDVVTIGGANQDIFMLGKEFAAENYDGEEYLILPAATKHDVPDIANDIGGGATNAGVTFARVGLKTACMAKIGIDGAGREIERHLEKERIYSLLVRDRAHQTGVSVILKGPQGEDTIFIHRGAGYEYKRSDFSLSGIETNWLYISSLGGDLTMLSRIIRWATLQGTRVAVNPGQGEIEKGARLKRILRQADVVIMNRPEAEYLFDEEKINQLFSQARLSGWHSFVITGADQGSWVLDGSYVYRSKLYKQAKVIDRTGAGDAYGAGFVAAVAAGKSIEQALSFAAANATSVIGYIGAKVGILRNLDVDTMDIKVSVFESESRK